MEVLDVNVLVGRRLPLAPQQQALFGRRLCGGREETAVKVELKRAGACAAAKTATAQHVILMTPDI